MKRERESKKVRKGMEKRLAFIIVVLFIS